MALTTNTQAIWTFESTLSDESLNGNDLTALGGNPTYARFQLFDLLNSRIQRRYGVQFDDTITFDAGADFDLSGGGRYRMVIAFWWTSAAALGQTRHVITRQLTPMIAPIVAKATSSINGGLETLSNAEFIISEIGVSKTQNAIRLALCEDGSSITHIIESTPYTPGLHNIYVSYQETVGGALGHARIDIDGQKGDIAVVGGLDSSVGSSVTVNDVGYGYTAHKTTSSGSILGDLLIQRTYGVLWDTLMIKMFRFGWRWGADQDFDSTTTAFNGLSYHQPSTVSTNQIFVEGSDIFVARSDGMLSRGYQPIWDIEFNYRNPSSLNLLTTSEVDATRTVTWTTAGLRVHGTSVRI